MVAVVVDAVGTGGEDTNDVGGGGALFFVAAAA